MGESNRKDEVLSRLTDGIARLTTPDHWHEWLSVQSQFHQYSFNNTLLIQLQCPSASRVAGFHAWRKLGRNARKGEKAIWILAPMTRNVRNDDADVDEGKRIISGFKPVPVFDVAQVAQARGGQLRHQLPRLFDAASSTEGLQEPGPA